MTTAALLAVAVFAPFAGFVAMLATRRRRRVWTALAWVAPAPTLVAVAALFVVDAPATLTLTTLWGDMRVGFAVEPMGLVFAGVVAVLWPIAAVYSLSYLRANAMEDRARFCAFFSAAIGATLGVAFAADLLTLLIFYEALTFLTYPLVTHEKNDKTRGGGRVYLAYLLGTSLLFLLPAIVWVYAECRTLTFAPGGFVGGCASSPHWLLLLFVYGVGKAAVMPLHRWLPAAMVAPAPVSALLHAVAVVKSGVFVLLKCVVYVFGFDLLAWVDAGWLVYLAGAAMLLASVIALEQDNLKKMLAYSTVGQLSYIVMGAALLRPALAGAMLHLIAHATAKITLFFAAGAIQTASGRSSIREMGGLAYAMPWTLAFFVVAAASLVGLPPLGGFVGKWFLLEGMVSPPHVFALSAVVLSTLLNLAYFGRVAKIAFTPERGGAATRNEAPAGMLFAMGLSTLLVVGMPLFSGFVVDLLGRVS